MHNTRVTTCYHPDGVSWRGIFTAVGITSVCKHAHSTEGGAIYCARKKRAAYNRGEISPVPRKDS